MGGIHGARVLIWGFASALTMGQARPIPGLPHEARYDLQGEITAIAQELLPFGARYSGGNSLPSHGQIAATQTATLYLGARPIPNVDIYINPEIAWGNAPGGGSGLGAALNGDLMGQPLYGTAPDLARAFVRWRIPVKQQRNQPVGQQEIGRAPNIIAGTVPGSRLILTAGKFAASDIFDLNTYANNPRTQFVDIAFVNGLAYDFAQDARGYDYGLSAALVNSAYSVRFGSFAMPVEPGSKNLSYNTANSHSEQLEILYRPQLLPNPKPPSILRLLGFRNVGNMGSYAAALAIETNGAPPDLGVVRRPGTVRTGMQIGLEQALADGGATGIFSRVGWADGGIETAAYAEADEAFSLGAQISGSHWKRKTDIVGLALGWNGISSSHQQYLAMGGQGFSLGDGALRYGREEVAECYYLYQATKALQLSLDIQWIGNPGYNQDRGPATALSLRARYAF